MYSSSAVENTPSTNATDDRRYSVSSFVSEPLVNEENLPIIPPPEGFTNGDPECTPEIKKAVKRNARPPLPAKPQFMANRNMNNNNRIQTQMASQYGTTKLKNLMLLRQPAARTKARRRFDSDDSCDSLSDTDDSCDEHEETLQGEDTKSVDAASAISSVSTHSVEQIPEEESGSFAIVKISIPEQKLTKCMQLKVTETVWTAKHRIIQSLAKKFSDPLNYGLYHEKLGTFLLDHMPVSEYIDSGTVGSLQMRYKCRRMEERPRNSKEGRQIAKMKSSSKKREFLNYVQQFSTDKIYSMIRKGMDPNFQCPNTGETPLTMLSSAQARPECVSVFMALMGGGAHLDFRNQRGFTPMHVAARSGNAQMIKTLLEFRASPDVVDGRDLTPLYHCILLGSDSSAARILVDNGCMIGCCDSQGWSEIHQACRHGRIQHLELLLSYENVDVAMVNARNASGNTPLHVCALYNQEMCAVTLLMHGADTSIRNYANQDAVQVAHVAANISLAQLINDYPAHGDTEHLLMRMRAESFSVPQERPPEVAKPETKKHNFRATWTPNSIMKHCQHYVLQKQHSSGGTLSRNKETYTSQDFESRFDSNLPPNAKIPEYSKSHYPAHAANGSTEDNQVRIVVKDYDAKTPNELSLRVGTRVIVLNSRSPPPGYHDGMIGNERGFFPQDCVEQVKLRRPHPDTGQRAASDNVNGKRNSDKLSNYHSRKYASAEPGVNHNMPDSISLVSFESSEDGVANSPAVGRRTSGGNEDMASLQPTSMPGIYHNIRSVALWKGHDGFGFILRGAKAEGPVRDFNPTSKYPALQYLESIEEGSNAHNAGLRSGDFIIKIGETDVRRYGHQQLVETIRACGEPLHMQVTTVVHRKVSETASVYSDSSSRQGGKHGKSDSISSALDQLDNILAQEDSDDQTATLRRLPGSRKLRSEDLQDLFARQNGAVETSSLQRHSAQQSTFSSARRPIRALPPSITSASAYDHHDPFSPNPTEDTVSLRSFSSSSSNSSTFTTWGRNQGGAPPPHSAPFKSHTVSAATGAGILAQNGHKNKKLPPPPPKRINSRLSVTIPEENTAANAPPITTQAHSTSMTTHNAPSSAQNGMAAAIAMAARSRAERASLSEEHKAAEQTSMQSPQTQGKTEDKLVETTSTKSVAELSSALSIALAAKQRILDQRSSGKVPPAEVKKTQGTSFTVNPAKSTITKTNNPPWQFTRPVAPKAVAPTDDRHILPPPPTHLPPPPPPGDVDDVTGLDLPPPPSFPPPQPQPEHHTRYNHMTFDELMNLPPPPSDLLPSPSTHDTKNIKPPAEFRRSDGKSKPTSLGLLPPPPIPPPIDDDDDGGCVSPTGADSLSNADSGVADVTGDGLNSSSHHRSTLSDHHLHDHIGDNHSTVSSVSTISTLSSEDGNSDFAPPSHVPDRSWPLREVRVPSSDDSKSKESPPSSPAGNMYLDILKKAKNKQNPSSAPANSSDSKKNFRPGITVTKMTFAPVSSIPPPAENKTESRPKFNGATFPPPPPEDNTPSKNMFSKAPASTIQTKKVEFTPKTAPTSASLTKPVEKTVIKTTPVLTKVGSEVKPTINSANNNSSPQKKPGSASSGKKPIAQWTVKDVSDWLRDLQLEMYIPTFEENDISGEHLPELGKDELIELGVKRVGHRLTIDRSVKKLLNPEA